MSGYTSFSEKVHRTRFAFRPLLEVMEGRILLSFITGASYPVGQGPHGVAVGDFNGDGHLDLAVAGHSGVSILHGNGDGTFQPAQSYFAGSNPSDVAVGDFNDDGKLDFAGTDSYDATVS